MERFLTKLRVYANPWRALDHLGRPQCVVPFDPTHRPDRGWVGAILDPELTRVTSVPSAGENRNPRQVTVFKFTSDAIELPLKNTQGVIHEHYIRAIQDGDLIPADLPTARRCRVKFADPKAVLEATKRDAIAKFNREYGAGAWEALGERRDAPPPEAPAGRPPPKPVNPPVRGPSKAYKE